MIGLSPKKSLDGLKIYYKLRGSQEIQLKAIYVEVIRDNGDTLKHEIKNILNVSEITKNHNIMMSFPPYN